LTVSDAAVLLDAVDYAWPGRQFGLRIDRFAVETGETLLLLGASGSGKSTLLSLIAGIVQPQSGRVIVAGQDLSHLRRSRRDRFRGETLGVIFQMFNLLPYASGLDNILLPLRFAPARRARVPDPRSAALALTRALGLDDAQVTGGAAGQLSVGQQQRIAVARALIGRPPILIADEPTSALDAGAQADFLAQLFAQVRETGTTLIMVSHDERIADRFDRVLPLDEIATGIRHRRSRAA
jgi:putative ABC transport system ATP-binding protein